MSDPERRAGFVYEPLSEQHVAVKACPFCGCNDITVNRGTGSCRLQCMNCHAMGPDWDYREERAIFSWNHDQRRSAKPSRYKIMFWMLFAISAIWQGWLLALIDALKRNCT